LTLNGKASLPVAVDTLGGDLGFPVQVEGAVAAYKEFGVTSILVGPEREIREKMTALGARDLPIEVINAPDYITMDDTPVKAVRRKPDASLCVAYRLVCDGRAASVISSGNSGAMMAAGRFICGTMPGIDRPAIATLMPSAGEGRPTVVVDSGANVDCQAAHLVQFAVMGSVYCTALLGIARPKVALLSNGTEESKGTDIIRSAASAISKMPSIEYVGYVEGRDVATGYCDVIVCDGFVGNVLLKSMEGCVRLVLDQIKHEVKLSLTRRIGSVFLRGLLKDVFQHKFDYTAYGGAPLLGLQKLAVVLHGSSGVRAVTNGIKVADSFSRDQVIEKLSAALSQVDDAPQSHTSLSENLANEF
jgi:glycerol-3-phosphate acyltransferase PlsX